MTQLPSPSLWDSAMLALQGLAIVITSLGAYVLRDITRRIERLENMFLRRDRSEPEFDIGRRTA